MAATTKPIDSCCSSSGFPRTNSAPQACCRFATVGATSSGISGIAPTASPVLASSARTSCSVVGVDPVGDHRDRVRVPADQFGAGQLDRRGDRLRITAPAVHHQHHRRADVGRNLRVRRPLVAGGHVGVVAADHHHRVVLGAAAHRTGRRSGTARPPDRRAVRVGDADRVVVGLVDPRMRDQQLDDRVHRSDESMTGRYTPTRPTRRLNRSTSPSATADLPDRPSGEAI